MTVLAAYLRAANLQVASCCRVRHQACLQRARLQLRLEWRA